MNSFWRLSCFVLMVLALASMVNAWTPQDANASRTNVTYSSEDGNYVMLTIDATLPQHDQVMAYKLQPNGTWVGSDLDVAENYTMGKIEHTQFGSNAGRVIVLLSDGTNVDAYDTTIQNDGTFGVWTGPTAVDPTMSTGDALVTVTGIDITEVAPNYVAFIYTGLSAAGEGYAGWDESTLLPDGANVEVIEGPIPGVTIDQPTAPDITNALMETFLVYRRDGTGIRMAYYDAGWNLIAITSEEFDLFPPSATGAYIGGKTYQVIVYKAQNGSNVTFQAVPYIDHVIGQGWSVFAAEDIVAGVPAINPDNSTGILPFIDSSGNLKAHYFTINTDAEAMMRFGKLIDTGVDAIYSQATGNTGLRPVAWVDPDNDRYDIGVIRSTNEASVITETIGNATINTSASYDFQIENTNSDCDELLGGSCGDTIAGVELTDNSIAAKITIADPADNDYRIILYTYLPGGEFDLSGVSLLTDTDPTFDKTVATNLDYDLIGESPLYKMELWVPYALTRNCAFCPTATTLVATKLYCDEMLYLSACTGSGEDYLDNVTSVTVEGDIAKFSSTTSDPGVLSDEEDVLSEIPLVYMVPLAVVIFLVFMFLRRKK
jgi:hypothetical protein